MATHERQESMPVKPLKKARWGKAGPGWKWNAGLAAALTEGRSWRECDTRGFPQKNEVKKSHRLVIAPIPPFVNNDCLKEMFAPTANVILFHRDYAGLTLNLRFNHISDAKQLMDLVENDFWDVKHLVPAEHMNVLKRWDGLVKIRRLFDHARIKGEDKRSAKESHEARGRESREETVRAAGTSMSLGSLETPEPSDPSTSSLPLSPEVPSNTPPDTLPSPYLSQSLQPVAPGASHPPPPPPLSLPEPSPPFCPPLHSPKPSLGYAFVGAVDKIPNRSAFVPEAVRWRAEQNQRQALQVAQQTERCQWLQGTKRSGSQQGLHGKSELSIDDDTLHVGVDIRHVPANMPDWQITSTFVRFGRIKLQHRDAANGNLTLIFAHSAAATALMAQVATDGFWYPAEWSSKQVKRYWQRCPKLGIRRIEEKLLNLKAAYPPFTRETKSLQRCDASSPGHEGISVPPSPPSSVPPPLPLDPPDPDLAIKDHAWETQLPIAGPVLADEDVVDMDIDAEDSIVGVLGPRAGSVDLSDDPLAANEGFVETDRVMSEAVESERTQREAAITLSGMAVPLEPSPVPAEVSLAAPHEFLIPAAPPTSMAALARRPSVDALDLRPPKRSRTHDPSAQQTFHRLKLDPRAVVLADLVAERLKARHLEQRIADIEIVGHVRDLAYVPFVRAHAGHLGLDEREAYVVKLKERMAHAALELLNSSA